LHSFSDDLNAARQAFDIRFRVGITGPVTFPNAAVLCEVAAKMPLESLLIETDAPFLTPVPHRGDRNEPAYVHLVADKIAKLRKASSSSIASATTANAGNLFHW
jgi:TatD DNase family protein